MSRDPGRQRRRQDVGSGLVALVAPSGATATLLARFLVVLVPFRVGQDTGPLDLALEPPERAVQRFVLPDAYLSH
jgi:hypothetical protein